MKKSELEGRKLMRSPPRPGAARGRQRLLLLALGATAIGVVVAFGVASRRAPPSRSLEIRLDAGIRVEASPTSAADERWQESLASLPREPDALLRCLRRTQLSAQEPKFRVTDRFGELEAFIRGRARAAQRPRPPLVLLGWDGADPRVVEDLLAAGHLPNLRALRERGAHGRLRSHAPYLSPLLWTSIATGKRPEEHGILDFVEPGEAGRLRPIGSSCRRSTTIWEIAAALERRVLVVNWWATEPASRSASPPGVVSDRWIREPARPGHPDLEPLRVGPGSELVTELLGRLIDPRESAPDPRLAELREHLAQAITTQQVVLGSLKTGVPDLVLAYFGLPDTAAHLFLHEMPPRQESVAEPQFRRFGGIVHGCYLLLDALLGELLAALPPDHTMLLVSDHGFLYGAERRRAMGLVDPLSDALHSPLGLYALAGPDVPAGASAALDLHSIAPIVLSRLGIPAADDMAGRVPGWLSGPEPIPSVPTHETDLAPPPLALLDGQPCTLTSDAPVTESGDAEALERLAALGYLAEEPGEAPVLALANYGRSLLDAGHVAGARRALGLAARRRPADPRLGFLALEAELRGAPLDAARIESLSRAHLRGADGTLRGEFAFVLVELWLASGREPEALKLAEEAAETGVDGALAGVLARLWIGDEAEALRWARAAALEDPVRTVDTLMAFPETFTDRSLRVDAILGQLAERAPIQELLRAPIATLGRDSASTRERAAQALALPATKRSRVDQLWLRRLLAWDAEQASSP